MAIATMVDPRVPSRDVGRHVQAELTNLLYHNTRGMHIAGLLVSLLLVITLRDTPLSPTLLGGWLSCMLAIEAGRGLLSRRFRHDAIALGDNPLWRRRFVVGSVAAALGWGAAGAFLFPNGDVSHQLFLTMVVVGAGAVTMPALAADLGGYLLFLLPASLPLAARLVVAGGEIQLTAGLMACVGIVLLTRMAFGTHKRLVEQLNIRFAVSDIAEELRNELADRRRAEEQLTQLANYDPLTGLANRTLCEHKLGRAIVRARSGHAQLAVLFLDLDRFKTINDSLGHNIGDEVLKTRRTARTSTRSRSASCGSSASLCCWARPNCASPPVSASRSWLKTVPT